MLPQALQAHLTTYFEAPIVDIRALSGGDINHAACVSLSSDQRIFVKWHPSPPDGMFYAEAFGLDLLAKADALRIPHVYFASENYLAMEWLGRGVKNAKVAAQLGEGLAKQHRFSADSFGLERANFCGLTVQQNTQNDDWATFFAKNRLGAQMEIAAQQNRLPHQRAQGLERLISRMGELLPARPPVSLLHGDLWGGNWVSTEAGDPALIDPAVYFGHREADIAFTEVFGGFPSEFYDAYQATWALDSGYRYRKDIYNLYHLLNHLNLFGESYGYQVDMVLEKYS